MSRNYEFTNKIANILTDAYKAFLETIAYVCFASIAIEEVVDNSQITNDGILQIIYQIYWARQ